jgi:thiamine pyrophosphate-dependent acetolactate synthase large subunit-like protein
LNPGASYRGLHDSLVNYGDNRPEIILCPHDGAAVQRRTPGLGQDIDGPVPDFAAMARSMGVHAEGPIDTPDEVGSAIRRAIEAVKHGRPALVDVITQVR